MTAPAMCGRGLHPMDGDNAGVQRSTGRRFCRACRNDRRRRVREDRRAAERPVCSRGHELTGDDVRASASGRPTCRACVDFGDEARRTTSEVDEGAPSGTMPTVPSAAVRWRGSREGREASALHRHALMVRGQWRP